MASLIASSSHADSRQDPTPERRGTRRILNPSRCRIWAQHSRPDEQLTDEACRALRESIARNGQHQPALGRPVQNDPECDVEIICGARRYTVARSLGRDLLLEVRNMTDAEAYVAMYEENVLREGDSPYVRGQILKRALRSGTYSSLEELGRAFNLSHSAVSRLIMIAQLPSIIVAAFSSSDEIREAWGVQLYKLWNDETTRESIVGKARAIATKDTVPSAREAYEILITPTGGTRKRIRSHRNIPIRSSSGKLLFHEQDQLARVMYIIPKTLLSPKNRDLLKQSITSILQADQ